MLWGSISLQFLKSAVRRGTFCAARRKLLLLFTLVMFMAIVTSQIYIKKYHLTASYAFSAKSFEEVHRFNNNSFLSILLGWNSISAGRFFLPSHAKFAHPQYDASLKTDESGEEFFDGNFSEHSDKFYDIPPDIKEQLGINQSVFDFNDTKKFQELLERWLDRGPPNPPYKVNFTLNHGKICQSSGRNLTLLITVTSSVSHAESRYAIRDTWGGYAKERGAQLLFFVGIPKNQKYRTRLSAEDLKFHDIIQMNFLDAYVNLSIKTIGLVRWVSEHCHLVKYVLKVDDDVFVNVENILDMATKNLSKTIIGQLAQHWPPVRSPKSKWYASYDIYPFIMYPDFVFGPSYILTGDCSKTLYETSLCVPFFHLEDVYLTGIVAEKAKIKRINQSGMFNTARDLQPCSYEKLFSSHGHTPPDIRRHWMWLRRKNFKCIH